MILIKTPRLIIKEYDYGEEADILELLQKNRDHFKGVLSEWVVEIDDLKKARSFIKKMKVGSLLKNIYALGVWLKKERRLVGEIVFFKVDWALNKMEVGSYIDSTMQGKGLITEAKRETLNCFFKEFKLEMVIAACDSQNVASQRVLEKCGFSRHTNINENVMEFYVTSEMLDR